MRIGDGHYPCPKSPIGRRSPTALSCVVVLSGTSVTSRYACLCPRRVAINVSFAAATRSLHVVFCLDFQLSACTFCGRLARKAHTAERERTASYRTRLMHSHQQRAVWCISVVSRLLHSRRERVFFLRHRTYTHAYKRTWSSDSFSVTRPQICFSFTVTWRQCSCMCVKGAPALDVHISRTPSVRSVA